MPNDTMNERERVDMLAEIADLYYKQGKTQAEIARYYDTNRFRIAKYLQDALNENIVEIHIHYSSDRNKEAEKELMELYPLNKVLVVNTKYSSKVETQSQVGKVGANYLTRLIERNSTIGVTWGKTLYSMISQIPTVMFNSVNAVQLTGDPKMMNPLYDARELVRSLATAFNGTYFYLNAPIYLRFAELKDMLYKEPVIQETMVKAKDMGVIISGIGGMSSIPMLNPSVYPYLTENDLAYKDKCIGSLFGYVLDDKGAIADIDLNKKLFSVDLDDLMAVPHRIVIGYGRHKVEVMARALKNKLYNAMVTDNDTAMRLIETR
ncbi:MAG: hypothetical protein LUF92_03860 [Clostridiales bacterium]|nr:hypothetical protein [Clostridiales bacterium]